MAVRLNAGTHTVTWVDTANNCWNTQLTGAAALNIFFNLHTDTVIADGWLCAKWSFFGFGQCFSTNIVGDELVLTVIGTGGIRQYTTTNGPVTADTLLRCAFGWTAGGVMRIVVNGVDCPLAVYGGSNDTVTGLAATVATAMAWFCKPSRGDTSVMKMRSTMLSFQATMPAERSDARRCAS